MTKDAMQHYEDATNALSKLSELTSGDPEKSKLVEEAYRNLMLAYSAEQREFDAVRQCMGDVEHALVLDVVSPLESLNRMLFAFVADGGKFTEHDAMLVAEKVIARVGWDAQRITDKVAELSFKLTEDAKSE